MSLKSKIEVFKRGAESNFNNSGFITPIFVTLDGDELAMLPLQWSSPADKDAFSNQLKEWIVNGYIKEYMMIIEAWTVKSKIGEEDDAFGWMKENGTLQHHPKRTECVMIQYSSPDEELDYIAEIHRDKEKPYLGEWSELNRRASNFPGTQDARFQNLWAKSKAQFN